MLENEIKNLKALNMRPKEEISIKTIFSTILKGFKENKALLDQYLMTEMGMEFDFDSAQKIFIPMKSNQYGNVDQPFINDFGRVSENMVPYGIVGLQCAKRIKLNNYLEIIKVCIETRNSLIIQPFAPSRTLDLIVSIINDVLRGTNDFNNIIITNADISKENVDLLLYIGSKQLFKSIPLEEKVFIGVGQYEIYVDEVIDDNMIEYAKQHGIKLYYPEENVFKKINKEGANYCTAIMARDKEKIREFIANVKSSFLLVNMSPMLVDKVNLFPEQLLKRKTTVIYE